MDAMAIGILGAGFIIFAWIYETWEEMKEHKTLIDLKFALVYITGVIILTVYSYVESIFVFLFLDVCLLIIIVFEIIYTVYNKKIRKK